MHRNSASTSVLTTSFDNPAPVSVDFVDNLLKEWDYGAQSSKNFEDLAQDDLYTLPNPELEANLFQLANDSELAYGDQPNTVIPQALHYNQFSAAEPVVIKQEKIVETPSPQPLAHNIAPVASNASGKRKKAPVKREWGRFASAAI